MTDISAIELRHTAELLVGDAALLDASRPDAERPINGALDGVTWSGPAASVFRLAADSVDATARQVGAQIGEAASRLRSEAMRMRERAQAAELAAMSASTP